MEEKRNIKGQPFAWTTKDAWEKIESLPFRKQLSCKMIYVALSIASRKQMNSSVVEIYKFDIARYGSMSEKTVQRYLPDLQEIGLIKVEPQDKLSNGKFKKSRIWLIDSISPLDTCETVVGQLLDKKSDIYKKTNKQIKEIITYLNKKTGKNFRYQTKSTKEKVNARLRDGFEVEDFKSVIDKKTIEWLNDKVMDKFLRPETLFGTKFESYLNEKHVKQPNEEFYGDY